MTAIHIKFPALTLKAGPRALARIRANHEFLELTANGRLGERLLTL
nr:hypothetical protein [Pseudomonas sp. A-RE-19]